MPLTNADSYLHVDLTTGLTTQHPLAEADKRRFLLGSGYAAWLFSTLHNAAHAWDDPASPLLIFNGLLNGHFPAGASRTAWCARSPLTGLWEESSLGGVWGAALHAAGYAGLLITGRSPQPVYLWLNGTDVELRPAQSVWGLNHGSADTVLRADTTPNAQIAGIGLAGERLVRYAAVLHNTGGQVHVVGRTGIGAVMGSKQLKALVVQDHPSSRSSLSAAAASRPALCAACLIGCNRLEPGKGTAITAQAGLSGFADLLPDADPAVFAHILALCNDYGMDTLSAAASIAFVLEARSLGLLPASIAHDLNLRPGDAPAIIACLHAIGQRTGMGDLLADGVDHMANHLNLAVTPFASARRTPSQRTSLYNSLGLCKFIERGRSGSEQLADLVNQTLRWGWTSEDISAASQRIFDLKQQIRAARIIEHSSV